MSIVCLWVHLSPYCQLLMPKTQIFTSELFAKVTFTLLSGDNKKDTDSFLIRVLLYIC
jgi:hypothetical protein